MEMDSAAEWGKRIQLRVDAEDDVAAFAAVATGWAAHRHEFLAAERDIAVAAFTAAHKNLCLIEKHPLNRPDICHRADDCTGCQGRADRDGIPTAIIRRSKRPLLRRSFPA